MADERRSRLGQAVSGTINAMQKEMTGTGGERGTARRLDQSVVDQILMFWPDMPRTVARKVIERYGPPNEGIDSLLIWYGTGLWKRTIVYRDEVPHNFPKPHTDLLEQFIDYRVPPDKLDDLAAYDGSVIPERTKGEISARCDMEEMNVLALNLAHDIVTGRSSVEEARKTYAETATAFILGRSSPYTETLQFEVPHGGTSDLDEPMIGPMMGQMTEQVKDKLTGEAG